MSTPNESRSPNRLDGRVALISGGAQGIGRAIATLFQREGACVFILDCDARSGNETAADLTGQNPHLPVKYLPTTCANPVKFRTPWRRCENFMAAWTFWSITPESNLISLSSN